ncbi:MAG TPA: transcription antitermination factor NusB [Rhodothermales bacterium]|nr:transcription antitermination factor NusB [Rhodothermales bacterium]
MSNRRVARERVMQALYAHELAGGDVRHFIETNLKPELEDPENLAFAESLFLRTLDFGDEADAVVRQHLQHWDLGRVALIDRILLRMAICEFVGFEDIPPKVTINEVIEIAKKYSTPKSGQFINGILDAVLLELQQQGRLKKSGRGLIGMETVAGRGAQ